MEEERIEKFLLDLKENMMKHKYRKCLEDIKTIETNNSTIRQNWKLRDLKIKCMLKIISKKFSKYSNISKIKGLSGWLSRVDTEVEKWLEALFQSYLSKNIHPLQDSVYKEQMEVCIQVLLEQCHNYALYARFEKNIADCAGFLALGERLIKSTIEFLNTPDSLNIVQQILLFISSLNIADNAFEIAKTYQSMAMSYCFKELQLRVGGNGINIRELKKSQLQAVEKIFINVVTAFYQMGVCEENLGNIISAIEAYRQSKWFSLTFLKHSVPILSQFICDIEKRAVNYHNLIKDVAKNQVHYKDQDHSRKKNKPQIFYDELNAMSKFEKTIEFIEGLKIPVVEEDEPLSIGAKVKSPRIKNILSTVNIVNHLTSMKFTDIVNKMDKMEVSKVDKDIIEKIRKKLREVKADEKYSSEDRINTYTARNSPRQTLETFRESFGTSLRQTVQTECDVRESNNFGRRDKSFKSTLNRNAMRKQNGNTSPTSCSVPKYKYSENIFKKSYRKKIDYLDALASKEYNFQKKLLGLKKFEKIEVPEVKEQKIRDECNLFFNKVLSSKTKLLKEGDKSIKKKEVLNESIANISKKKEKFEISAIKSLNNKALNKAVSFNRRNFPKKVTLRKEFIVETEKKLPDKGVIENANKLELTKVQMELNLIDKREKLLKTFSNF